LTCGHAKYLTWKFDSGFLELSAQQPFVTQYEGYCWFCGFRMLTGTVVRWFPFDHVAFHEECVSKLGWQRRYLNHEDWRQLRRKIRAKHPEKKAWQS